MTVKRHRLVAGLGAAALASVLAGGCREGTAIEAERTIPYDEAVATESAPATASASTAATGRRGVEGIGEPLLVYRQGERPCRLLMAGPSGVATGACGGKLARKLYSGTDRAERLRGFVERFAPFEIDVDGEELELYGRGTEEASATGRRMVLEWTRRLDQEAAGVPRNAAMGLAFAWHREMPAGGCEDLAVYLTGDVRASACGDGSAAATAALPLNEVERIYEWHDRHRSFQVVTGGTENGQEARRRLLFAGGGESLRDDDLVAALDGFSSRTYREAFADELRRAEEARLAEQARIEAAVAAAAAEERGRRFAVPPADPVAGTPAELLPAPSQIGVGEPAETDGGSDDAPPEEPEPPPDDEDEPGTTQNR